MWRIKYCSSCTELVRNAHRILLYTAAFMLGIGYVAATGFVPCFTFCPCLPMASTECLRRVMILRNILRIVVLNWYYALFGMIAIFGFTCYIVIISEIIPQIQKGWFYAEKCWCAMNPWSTPNIKLGVKKTYERLTRKVLGVRQTFPHTVC
jgi:hypothetical protein